MILLGLKGSFRDEERKVRVLHPLLLDFGVDVGLDLLPDEVRIGTQDVATGDFVVSFELE